MDDTFVVGTLPRPLAHVTPVFAAAPIERCIEFVAGMNVWLAHVTAALITRAASVGMATAVEHMSAVGTVEATYSVLLVTRKCVELPATPLAPRRHLDGEHDPPPHPVTVPTGELAQLCGGGEHVMLPQGLLCQQNGAGLVHQLQPVLLLHAHALAGLAGPTQARRAELGQRQAVARGLLWSTRHFLSGTRGDSI